MSIELQSFKPLGSDNYGHESQKLKEPLYEEVSAHASHPVVDQTHSHGEDIKNGNSTDHIVHFDSLLPEYDVTHGGEINEGFEDSVEPKFSSVSSV